MTNNRLLLALNLLLAAGLVLLYADRFVDLGAALSFWNPETANVPYARTVAESIAFWGDRPTIAVPVSLFLMIASLVVAILLPDMRRLAILIAGIVIVRHFWWRVVDTLHFDNPASATVGILLFLAECYGVVSITLGFYQMYRPVHRSPPKLPDDPKQRPSVDILIPSYTEPMDVMTRTIVGAIAIDYPEKRVFVLDDGRRPELAALCEQLGCGYFTRPDNRHAKAGNLNHALARTDGDLVAVFDADHVPVTSFLRKTVPYFRDKTMGFVQTPQHFATEDPFQRNLIARRHIANEQDLFYHVILPGMDALGAVTFAGSGTVFRRRALDDVGGFAVETVTEDLHTGMRLHDRGWKSLYVNEDLAAGLAPESFGDFLNQRLRWGRGATQVFVIENPLLKKGLTLAQKLSYFNALWYFLHGLPRIVFLCAPVIYLLFGIVTIQAPFYDVVTYYLCYFVVSSVTTMQVAGQVRQSQWSELYETAFCFFLAGVTALSFISPYKAHFKVTPKGGRINRLSFEMLAVLPQLLLFGLTLVGFLVGAYRAYENPATIGTLSWNGFWAAYNCVLLICAILAAVNRPQRRACPRVERHIPVSVQSENMAAVTGHTVDVGEGGAQLVLDEPVPVRKPMNVRLMDWGQSLQTEVTGRIIRSRLDENGRHRVSLRFEVKNDTIRQKLIRHTYTAPDTWRGFHQPIPPFQSLIRLLQSPLRWLRANERPGRRIAPRFKIETPGVLLGPRGLVGIGAVCELSEGGAAIRLPGKYHRRMAYMTELRLRMTWPDSTEVVEIPVMIVRQAAASGDAEKDGTGARTHTYGLIFPDLMPDMLARIQRYIYQPKVVRGQSLDVLEAKKALSLNQRQWLAQFRITWGNVTPVHTERIQVHYIPFGLQTETVAAHTGNVIPFRGRVNPSG